MAVVGYIWPLHLWLLSLSCSSWLSSRPALSHLGEEGVKQMDTWALTLDLIKMFSTRPEDVVGALGSPLTLRCTAYGTGQQRALLVQWARASAEQSVALDTSVHQLSDGSLFFPRLTERHLGTYKCSVGGADSDNISTTVRVGKAGLGTIFFSPQSQTVKEGDGVFFQCVSGDSSPAAHITWLKDGILATTGRHIQGQYGGGQQKKTSGTLHLSNVTLEDGGMYVCVTHNSLLNVSSESTPAKLTVLEIPRKLQITQGPDNITVAMGTEAFMHCVVRGFPVPMVHWFKDGCPLANCSASFSIQDNGQLLVFRNVSKEDEGSYHCEASNHRGAVKSLTAFLLPAVMDWSFVLHPSNQTAMRGHNVTLLCRPPHSRPKAQVSWFRNNKILSPETHFNVMTSGDLCFYSVQESDHGTYFCRASNAFLQRFVSSRRATLKVLAPPSVKLRPQVVTAPVGAQVILECEVWGYPPPSIRWFKRGHSLQTGGKISVTASNSTLLLLSVRSYDEGTYTCQGTNTVGRTESTAMLRVAVGPIIVSIAGQVSTRLGASVTLPCKAIGILPITYTWTRARADTHTFISPTKAIHTDGDGALHISNVDWSDAGEHFCTAKNRAGHHQKGTVLTVTDKDLLTDRAKDTRLMFPARTSIEKLLLEETQMTKTRRPDSHSSHVYLPTPNKYLKANAHRFNKPTGLPEPHSQHMSNQPALKPIQSVVTQLEPPVLMPSGPNVNGFHTTLETSTWSLSSQILIPHSQITTVQTQRLLSRMSGSPNQFPESFTQNQNPTSQVNIHLSDSVTVSSPLQTEIQLFLSPLPSQDKSLYKHTLPQTFTVFSQPSETSAQILNQRSFFQLQPYPFLVQQHSTSQPRTSILQSLSPQNSSSQARPLQASLPQSRPPQNSLSQSRSSQTLVSQSRYSQPSPFQSMPSQASLPQKRYSQNVLPQSRVLQTSVPNFRPSQTSPSQSRSSKTSPPQTRASQTSLPQLRPSQPSPLQSIHIQTSLPQISHLQNSMLKSRPSQTSPSLSRSTQTSPPQSRSSQPSLSQPRPSQTSLSQPRPSQPSLSQPRPSQTLLIRPFLRKPLLPFTLPTESPTEQYYQMHTQPLQQHTETQPPNIQPRNTVTFHSLSTSPTPNQSYNVSTLHNNQVTASVQVLSIVSQSTYPVQSAKSSNDTDLSEWLKRNTSQSPMTSDDSRVTQQSPSWLPVLEKHDIPIVVGVGVSLAFIFITMAFYSLVQKNEPVPRTAQRNLGVPIRHAECRTTGRSYDNRAFENDECVAVIEQSPNTSDTHARPPGPNLVMVQMETTSEDPQDYTQCGLDDYAVTVETYPEPVLDTEVDPSLEEETCSLSQPSVLLQCLDDWPSSGGDNQDPCQDTLPSPPSPSPSLAGAPPAGDALRSSLTLHTSLEAHMPPIQHSLSITHSNVPLLFSHHVSMGPTTVAVDVHFQPADTAAVSIGTDTQLYSVSNSMSITRPLVSAQLPDNVQDSDLSASRNIHYNK